MSRLKVTILSMENACQCTHWRIWEVYMWSCQFSSIQQCELHPPCVLHVHKWMFCVRTSSWASAPCACSMCLMGWVVSMCALCSWTRIFYRQYLIFFIFMESGFLRRLLLSFSGSALIMINISDVPPKSMYWHWFKVWPLLTYILLWMCFCH